MADELRSELLSPAELASKLGVCVATIRRWTRAGKLPVVKLSGRTWRFRMEDVQAALQSMSNPNGRQER